MYEIDNFARQQLLHRHLLCEYRYFGSLPSEYFPSLANDHSGVLSLHPWNMHGEHWMFIANCCNVPTGRNWWSSSC